MKEKVSAVLSAKEVSILFAIQCFLAAFLKIAEMNFQSLILALFLTALYLATATAIFNRCREVYGLPSLGWERGLKTCLSTGWRAVLVIFIWVFLIVCSGVVVAVFARDLATNKETATLLLSPVTLLGAVFLSFISVMACLAFVSGDTKNLTRRSLAYVKSNQKTYWFVTGAFLVATVISTFGPLIMGNMESFSKVFLVLQMFLYQLVLPVYLFGVMIAAPATPRPESSLHR